MEGIEYYLKRFGSFLCLLNGGMVYYLKLKFCSSIIDRMNEVGL